jgi:hypothetical protein
LCYRNTCLPSTVSTTKFPSALIIPAPLLFPIARLPSSVDHGGGSGCCCGCGLWPWSQSWCPERSCVGPACVSPPHRRSAHQPPHEQLLVRLGVGGVSSVGGVSPVGGVHPVGGVLPVDGVSSRWSVVRHRRFHTPSTPRAGVREAGGAWVIGAMVSRDRGARRQ